ncbi:MULTISPECIES: ABC transporter substrate-binding protein [unclassified Bordetella]|uniref:ABC transporter substrate-binding protein n=1 Tax=unclassified Bordetella TaxID=2630031 RepID=UPI0013269905|nr:MULTISPECIES: ABC transporter substrate-binding protein [unclassified Bordetella]MVW70015.1 ABC transporter substrate-binding protein [Bordetella sp. 15P40C-2]MVW78229.1 ABC transporter substrate-binding protein [Bordetella sp. 02P26C-1]
MSNFSRRQILGMLGASLALPTLVMAQDAAPIRIGVMLPLSGNGSIEGNQVFKGVQLAVAEANAAGGVLGRKIELAVEDDESNTAKGATAVRKLVEREKVPFIVGTYASAVVVAAMKVAKELKVPMLSGGSTSHVATDNNTPGDPWFFRAFADSKGQGYDTAMAIVEKFNGKKVAILHDTTSYGQDLAKQTITVVEGAGGKIVANESFNIGDQDFSSILTRIRTLKPDVVYIAGWAADGATIVRQAASVGLRTQFVGSGSMLSDDFIKLAGPASEGFAVATAYEISTPNQVGREFGERFVKAYGYEPGMLNTLGYFHTAVGLEALRRVGKPDGEAIQKMLMSGMKDFKIGLGPEGTTAAFDEKGSVDYPYFIAVIKNGKRVLN